MVDNVDTSGDSSGTKRGKRLVVDNGGFDYHFVASLPDSSDIVCKICNLPSRNPHLSSCCGHTFCKSCMEVFKEKAIHGVVTDACPVCGDSEFPVVQNKLIDRAVRSLHIYCTNKKEGCTWLGEINDIVEHLSFCQYEGIECTNGGCRINIQRQFLSGHMDFECQYRDVNCWHCHLKGTCYFIEGKHKDECPKVPVPCPNGCEVGTVLGQDLDEHRKICPLEMIRCEYYGMGCETEFIRKDLNDHNGENVDKHLDVLKCELANTRKDLAQAQKDIACMEKRMVDMQKEFQKQIDDIENQNQEGIKRLEIELYKSIDQLHKSCNSWTLKLDALAKLNTTEEQVVPVVLKLTNFAKLKKEKKWWYSDPFYSLNREYKMRLLVCVAGDTDGTSLFVSMWLSILNGPASGPPLQGKIKLLNQIDNTEHHCVAVECCNSDDDTIDSNWTDFREWRNSYFISHNSLKAVSHTCSFLKNDGLFFEVFVKVHNDEMSEDSKQSDTLLSHTRHAYTQYDMDSSSDEQEANLYNEHIDATGHLESSLQQEPYLHEDHFGISEPRQKPCLHKERMNVTNDVQSPMQSQKPRPHKEGTCTADDTKVRGRKGQHVYTYCCV